jgi:archaellum component FlaC
MASEEETEARFSRLEHDVRLARTEASHALVLAKGADRDVASFGDKLAAQQRLIEAVRETQVTHGQRLDGIDQKIERLDRRVERVDRRVDGLDQKVNSLQAEMREGFARQAIGQAQITALLTRIIDDK